MKVKILSTSDVHGYVYPTDYSTPNNVADYGMLKAATLIKQQKQAATADEIVIAVENGDWIQGSPLTSYVAKQTTAKQQGIFSQITSNIVYDAGVLGNHEFNYGLDYLRAAEKYRNYPLLGANIAGGRQQQIVDAPYTIVKQKGIKVAILGLTTAYIPVWEQADHLTGLNFKSALETAKLWVPRLREMADVVVVAYHGGLEGDLKTGLLSEKITAEDEGYRILTQVSGIDALITGHQHRHIAAVYNGLPITQPGERGRFVGCIEIQLDKNNEVQGSTATLLATEEMIPDSPLTQMTAKLEQKVQTWLDHPLGQVNGPAMTIVDPMQARLHGHPYLQFINQVEMAATGVDIAATALFNNEVRGYEAEVTIRQVLNSYGYPNTLVVERITGADLKAALERCASFFEVQSGQVVVAMAFVKPKIQYYNYDFYSGIDYEFDLRQPVGSRVTKLKYHGETVTAEQTLQVAMNQYRGNGGGEYDMFGTTKVVKEVNLDMTELITDYFEKNNPVTATQPKNFQVKW